jgi:hypothetical protein
MANDEGIQPLGLDDLARGAAGERWNHEFERLLENILDLNRDAETKRTIILKIELTPNEDRKSAEMAFVVDSKLAPLSRVKQQVHFGRIKGTGRAVAVNVDLGQHDMFRAPARNDVLPITKGQEAQAE